MLLFQKRFHAGLVGGEVTRTYRQWDRARVKPGGRYRCHPIGVLEVDQVREVSFGQLTDADARAAGFHDRAKLRAYLAEVAKAPLGDTTRLWEVRLHHGGEDDRVPLALEARLCDADVDALARKLAGLDRRSARGPWTRRTLGLIQRHPRVAASQLARKEGLETLKLKADVVKLKKLGLTMSFEVGYELSPRGRAFLRRRQRW